MMSDFSFEKRATREAVEPGCTDVEVVGRSLGRQFVVDTIKHQWRFMWPHANGDEVGATWRDEKPTAAELAEWYEDFTRVWIERRTVVLGKPEPDQVFPTKDQ